MSVVPVSMLSVIGPLDKLNEVINFCGNSKVFQPENALSFYSDTKGLKTVEVNNIYRAPLENMIRVAKEVGKEYSEKEDSDKMTDKELFDASVKFSKGLDRLVKKKQQLRENLSDTVALKQKISHFVGLDLNFKEIIKCQFIKIRLGRLPKESKEKLNEYKDNPYVLFFTATEDEKYEWGLYISPVDHVEEVDMIFSKLYFERLRVYGIETTPENQIIVLQDKIEKLKNKINQTENDIIDYWNRNKEFADSVFSQLKKLYTYCDVQKYAARYNNSFILMGWIPKSEKSKFEKGLEQIGDTECAFDNPDSIQNHTPPTILKNKKFFKPFEYFVDMYGMPAYKEVDPTAFVSLTYILLFGIMFGDFGNGLVLSIAGYLMWKLKNMALGKILIPCGVSSMLFGVLFGSCFGYEDAFDGLYHKVFNLPSKPISVMEPQTTNNIIYTAVAIGFVLVAIAMLINIYSCFRRRNLAKAIFGANGICGFVFYVSLVAGIVCQLILAIPVMNIFYIIFLLILPLLGILFEPVLDGLMRKDKSALPEKWGEFFMQSFFEVFEVCLSYATNTISFLRVGAYVLVHTGMLMVVFTLAEMTSGVMNILIVALGNLIVIVLEGLLVGIQVLRLEFYEMFSRFYDGDGEPFTPIKVPRGLEIIK